MTVTQLFGNQDGSAGRSRIAEQSTLLDRAQSSCAEARRLREQSAAARARLAGLKAGLGAHPAAAWRSGFRLMQLRAVCAEVEATNLRHAVTSNRRIGMAVGILMARHGLTDDQAWEALRRQSQRTNRKVRDLAEEIIDTGNLPRAANAS